MKYVVCKQNNEKRLTIHGGQRVSGNTRSPTNVIDYIHVSLVTRFLRPFS